ncbi:MAG: hypothetical protein CV089_02360, partial [Nitrospira sp. WS110]|nr:hypothetical protein [Nitrospira sp. WS110]
TELSDLFAAYTSQETLEEATKFPTIPTAGYNVKIMDWKLRDASDKSPFPPMQTPDGPKARPMIVLQGAVLDDAGKRIATVWPEVSYVPYRVYSEELSNGKTKKSFIPPDHEAYDRSLPLDAAFKLWASLSKLVDPKGVKSVGDVLRQMPAEFLTNMFITESFRDEATMEYYDYKTVEERTELQKAGHKSYNNVRRIGKARAAKKAA